MDYKPSRIENVGNPYQGAHKRVLCVCLGGLLRSPTLAWVLGNAPYNFNTRSCGVSNKYSLIVADDVLVEWADEIVCAEPSVLTALKQKFNRRLDGKPLFALNIEDRYGFRSPELVKIIHEELKQHPLLTAPLQEMKR